MTKRQVCDRCLTPNRTTQAYLKLRLEYTDPAHPTKPLVATTMDVCPKCAPVVDSIITDRLMLTETPEDVRNGSLFGRGTTDSVPFEPEPCEFCGGEGCGDCLPEERDDA